MKLTLHCNCGNILTEELISEENGLLECDHCGAKVICTATQLD